MKKTTLAALTPSAVRVCTPASWRSLTLAVSLEPRTALTAGHESVQGEKSAFSAKQILGGMTANGYGFANPVDVDAQRVRVATGAPPRSRPV